MGSISLQIPQTGQPNSTEDPKIASDLTTIQTAINGGLDSTNLSASAAITRSQLAGGVGNLAFTAVTTNTSATDGHFYSVGAGSVTVTLPAPTANFTVGVGSNVGGAAVTIAKSTGNGIWGVGMSGASSMTLGVLGSFVVLLADGTNWWVVSGEQDTGWQALSLATNVGVTAGAYTPAARLIGSLVTLCGSMVNNTGGTINSGSTWATVPAGLRPASSVPAPIWSAGGTGGQIATTGIISSLSANIPNGGNLNLDGITYRLG